MTDDATPGALRPNDGLGAADPERADFEAWAARRWGREAYRHTSATCSEWDAWQAGSAAQRARTADLCGNMAAISWAEWDEKADPTDQGKALALEHVAVLLAEPNARLSGPQRPAQEVEHGTE